MSMLNMIDNAMVCVVRIVEIGSPFSAPIFQFRIKTAAKIIHGNTVRKDNEEKLKAQWAGFKNAAGKVHTVRFDSRQYFRVLASAGRVINDNTFMPMYMKKPAQL